MSVEVYFILLFLGILSYFIWERIFRKHIPERNKRKVIVWILTIISAPVIYIFLIGILMYYITYDPCRDFNQAEWFKEKDTRFEMGDNIIKSKMLIGKDSFQVKDILGFPSYSFDSTRTWIYGMGLGGGGLGFQFHNLSVKFEKGKVVSVIHGRLND